MRLNRLSNGVVVMWLAKGLDVVLRPKHLPLFNEHLLYVRGRNDTARHLAIQERCGEVKKQER